MRNMKKSIINRTIFLVSIFVLICCGVIASESLFYEARTLQRSGKFDEAIEAYKNYLTQPVNEDDISDEDICIYADALVQLMNTFQSKGDAEGCISTLQEVYNASPILQKKCLRDYYSVMGYALSRTERMKEAEETMLKAFTIPLYNATPQNYFRDYAYAAAVFYSNPNYQNEVINWCKEALLQAELCENTSGTQWVKAMLGSLYKKNGLLKEALELFQQSKEDAEARNDDLGVLNSLNTLTDLFLYWDIPEYANRYASEAIAVERRASAKNPMVSAQVYINKGRALRGLGMADSLHYYAKQARELCQPLPYNSGMVDVDLLRGSYLTERGGDSLHVGIEDLERVTLQGTRVNRAKAYHQLAQTYLRAEQSDMAGIMLDSLYMLLSQSDSPMHLSLDYEPILIHYAKVGDHDKVRQYVKLMLHEQKIYNANRLNYKLVEGIVDLQTEQKNQQLKIMKLRVANLRLLFSICIGVALVIISVVIVLFFNQKRRYTSEMKRAEERFESLGQELNQSNIEKERVTQEIKEFLKDNDNRQELETLTPHILKESGETKFRQCFELLYPLFLHRLRERVPSITRREELLSMLIVLKQGTKEVSELLAIAPRSVLMLRHRFRQKIGIESEYSLENFIEDTLGQHGSMDKTSENNAK